MQYENLKAEIDEDIENLAKKIEKFCVLDNKEYLSTYKSKLWSIHEMFEDL